jgi:hypothetical protein
MGRFDALTKLDDKKAPAPADASPVDETATEKQTKTSLLANQQTSKLASKQTSKEVNQQTSKLVNQQTSLPANSHTSKLPLSTKEKKKYGTYLREDSILDIQIRAAQSRLKDHELLQEIVDAYFKNPKN